MPFRPSQVKDETFVIETARHACTLDGCTLPAPDSRDVLALRARNDDILVLATDDSSGPLLGRRASQNRGETSPLTSEAV